MEFSVNSLTILNSWAEPLLRAGVFYILDHSSHDERMSVPYRNIYVKVFHILLPGKGYHAKNGNESVSQDIKVLCKFLLLTHLAAVGPSMLTVKLK